MKNDFELVTRYSAVTPSEEITDLEEQIKQYTFGMNKYIRGHRIKLQWDLTYEKNIWLKPVDDNLNRWQVRFQVEAGI